MQDHASVITASNNPLPQDRYQRESHQPAWSSTVFLLALCLTAYGSISPVAAQQTGQVSSVKLPGGASMEFVWIEPGTFTRGSVDGRKNETPTHSVTLSNGFYLGRYELTQAQWTSVMGTRPWAGKKWVVDQPDYPAVYISWENVQALIQRLNQAAGQPLYRLPTEAEWEYACRAGTNTAWHFGNTPDQASEYAWYIDNIGAQPHAQQIGTKQPNPWGLYDMTGNVWEWCQDWLAPYTADARTDPLGPLDSSGRRLLKRVKRGGAFFFFLGDQSLRSAYRDGYLPNLRYAGLGARLVRLR